MKIRRFFLLFIVLLVFAVVACKPGVKESARTEDMPAKGTYGWDAAFLRTHTNNLVELSDQEGKAKVVLSADYQGRVMTSTASGDTGRSFGWINYALIESGEFTDQFNPVGGEERLWFGPEGGQFSLYFKGGNEFDIANWQVPAIIDTVPFDIKTVTDTSVVFFKSASLKNYSGTAFKIDIERSIRLLSKSKLEDEMGIVLPPAVAAVAFETENKLKNAGSEKWAREGGLISIWLLGMFSPSPQTSAIIPFKGMENAAEYISDNYFGEIPAGRLIVKDSILYFSCDGKYRSKIGLAPEVAKPVAGSFDFENNVLTIIKFPVDREGLYVNSKWEMQDQPFKGDVVNSYNDGPLADGSQLGPFYELESSSPASELAPGETQQYRQVTSHFEGPFEDLANLAKELLGVDLNELKNL